jgi:hypothetical protein
MSPFCLQVDGLSGMLSGMSFTFAEFDSVYQVQLKLAPLTVALDFYDMASLGGKEGEGGGDDSDDLQNDTGRHVGSVREGGPRISPGMLSLCTQTVALDF